MRILPVNLNPFPKRTPRKQNLNFLGGYKDIRGEYEREMFERRLDGLIRNLKDNRLHIPKRVIVKGKPANLTVCKNGTYILQSEDDDIKAVMAIVSSTKPLVDCDSEYYSKNIGYMFIDVIYSKGNGAGSFLVKEAVKKSKEMGFDGRLTVFASNINQNAGNPIPFYEKMGFKAFNSSLQEIIERNLNKEKDAFGLNMMPTHANMYLDEKKIKDYLD